MCGQATIPTKSCNKISILKDSLVRSSLKYCYLSNSRRRAQESERQRNQIEM